MARIRTIKPDFWTDEKLVECSASARLLFIGMWNFADDNGNLQRSSKKLKMQILPSDDVNCEKLVLELLAQGILVEYHANDEMYLHIKGFHKHQKIDHPSKTTIPIHTNQVCSSSPREDSPSKGRDLIIEESKQEVAAEVQKAPRQPPTPSEKIDFYRGEANESAIDARAVLPISGDFDPPNEWGEFAGKLGLSKQETLIELEKFIAYFTVGRGAGKRRSKRGWRQSWSTWISKTNERRK